MRWTSLEDLPIDLQGTARQVVADMTRRFPDLDVETVAGVVVGAFEVACDAVDDRPLVRHVEELTTTALSTLGVDGSDQPEERPE